MNLMDSLQMRPSVYGSESYASGEPASTRLNVFNDLIPIELEIPPIWLNSPLDGERHRQMYAQLCCVLATRPVAIHMTTIGPGMHAIERQAPAGGFTLSYHSVGEGPNIWRIKETPIAGWYSVDENGYSGWSSLARFPEKHAGEIAGMDAAHSIEYVSRVRNQLRQKNESKYKQHLHDFNVERPYVYFPLQVMDDPVSQFCRLDTLDVLTRAAELSEQTGITLVVKRHPLCESPVVEDALRKLQAGFRHVVVSQASVHQHLEGCQSVIVANSGVGMEALMYFKPVFSFAASEYELATHSVHSLDALQEAFAPPQVDAQARCAKFMAYYLQRCCFSIHDLRSVERVIDTAIQAIRPAASVSQAPSSQAQLQNAMLTVNGLSRKLAETTLRADYLARLVKEAQEKLRELEMTSRNRGPIEQQPIPAALEQAVDALTNTALSLFEAAFDNADADSSAADFIGDWKTESGQVITFADEFAVLLNGRTAGRWVHIDGGAAVQWTGTDMLDIALPEDGGETLMVTTSKGESFRVNRSQ